MLENEIYYLSNITVVILGLLFLIFFYLLLRKVRSIRKKIDIEMQKESYHHHIFKFLMDGMYSRGLVPRTKNQLKAIEDILSHYSKLLKGEQVKTRLNFLAELYLAEHYRNLLTSRKWSHRMNALYHIEDFQLKALLKEVKCLIAKKNVSQEEATHILRILATFQTKDLFEILTEKFDSLSEYEYRNLLIRIEKNQFDQFVLGFHKCQNQLQKAILDVIAVKKEMSYCVFTESVFFTYSNEVKVRALKTLAELGYVKKIKPYLDLLTSTKWEERMISAKLFGELKETRGIPGLINLMHDSIWWVRSQAGHAISKFPNGEEILQRVYETTEDPFARDMAWEWLQKGG
jgi:HEAT repeat protein